MTLKTKLAVAFAVSLALMAGLCFLLLLGPSRKDRDGAGGGTRVETKSAPEAAPPETEKEAAPAPAVVAVSAKEQAQRPSHAVFSPDEVWTLTGRIVKPDNSGTLWPVEGAAVYLKPHPRRTKPEDAPPPQKKVTGADGRFELAGCPGRLSMRIEVDEPSSAYRAFSFQLGDPDATGSRDLGDIPLEPALSLAIELVGPKGEPVEKGYILVGRENSVEGLALQSLRVNDSRREAKELGGGKYVLERTGSGLHSFRVMAPGCAGTKDSCQLPREEPLVIHMQEGRRAAGTVVTSDGKPLAGATVEVDSGPNLSEPDPKTVTDASGHFMFDVLSDGNYDISAKAEGYTKEKKRGVPSGTEDLEFTLAPEAVFSGKVVAAEDGRAIAKAKVTLSGIQGESFSADSDANGLFAVRRVPAGVYTISANHREYAAAAEEQREVQEGQKIDDLVIRLPAGLVAAGHVVDGTTKEPVPDAQVFFDLTRQGSDAVQGPGVRKTGKTGSDGRFEVKGLGEGSYTLSARAKAFLPGKSRKVEMQPGGEKDFTVTLDLGSSIEGRVLDASGNPIQGATVKPSINFTSPEEWNGPLANIGSVSATTDAEGKYRLEGLGAHKAYSVKATHKDFAQGSSKGIQVGPRDAVDGIDITMPRGGGIRGRVLDANGAGIAGAGVRVSGEKPDDEARYQLYVGNSNEKAATTDAEGTYAFSAVGAGKYTVHAQAKGRMSAQKTGVDVVEGMPTDGVDIVMGAGETVAGRVTDAEGNSIAGADVNLYAEGNAQTQTDSEGRFKLIGLAQGQVTMSVQKQGFNAAMVNATVPGSELAIRLDRLAKIVGNLRAKGQEVFRNFEVIAMRQQSGQGSEPRGNRDWTNSSRNDPSGRFEVDVGPGTYVLESRVEAFAPARTDPITVKAGERVEGIFIDLTRGGKIRGVVVARGTGEPIDGANVYALSPQVNSANSPFGLPGGRSDADGSFTLEGIPDGVYNVEVTHDKHAQGNATGVAVRVGETTVVRIELGAGGGVRGVVTKGGAPIAGAMVYASKVDGGGGKQATTDADGRFEMNGLAEGEYTLNVSAGGRRGGSFNSMQKVTVYEGQITDTEVAQAVGIRLFGRVTSGGVPLRGGRIDAISPQRGSGGNGVIDPSGDYSIELPGPGAYMLMIHLPGQGGEQGAKIDVTVPAGSTETRQDIELPSGEISGVVLDAATDEAVRNAQVIAFPSGVSTRNLSAMLQGMKGMSQTDSTGRFSIAALPPGIYTIRVFAEGYSDGLVNGIKIDERRSSRDNRIALERGVSFRARVVDLQGRPVQGAMIFLRGDDGGLVQLTRPHVSGDDGTIDLAGIRPAVYEVSVVHPSYAAAKATVEAQEGAEAILRVQPGGSVTVHVANRQGRPVEGASVELIDESGDNVIEDFTLAAMMRGAGGGSATAADGSLVIDQVLPGKYRIAARSGDARSRDEKIVVEQGKNAEARLTVPE